jgi:hypothetical protein
MLTLSSGIRCTLLTPRALSTRAALVDLFPNSLRRNPRHDPRSHAPTGRKEEA